MVVLKVEDMSCNHCVERIHNVLEEAKIKHSIELETKTVTVENDTEVEKAIEEMDDIGFDAVKK